jgi:hypothetical protein
MADLTAGNLYMFSGSHLRSESVIGTEVVLCCVGGWAFAGGERWCPLVDFGG